MTHLNLLSRTKLTRRLSCSALACLALGCNSTQDPGDLVREVSYSLTGKAVHTLPGGTVVEWPIEGSGDLIWDDLSPGITLTDNQKFMLSVYASHDSLSSIPTRIDFFPSDWVQPKGTRGWPVGNEVLKGELWVHNGNSLDFEAQDVSVVLNEAQGEVLPIPETATEDYVRDFTIKASFDCSARPELHCEGLWEYEARGKVTKADIRLFDIDKYNNE